MTKLLQKAYDAAAKLPAEEQDLLASRVLAELAAEDDFDRAIAGDSRERIAVALNLRQQPQAVFRFDFYHEWRRDRFAILTPAAGVAFGVGTYF